MQRNEIKFKLNNYNLIIFKNKTKLFSAFPQRKIFSIYFDTFDFKDFIDSEEGTVPRKKIRLRYYNSFYKNLNKNKKISGSLELKKTLDFHREKKSIKIFDTLENSIAVCKRFLNQKRYPVCAITYQRNYYTSFSGIRITVDKNIQYYKINNDHQLILNNFEKENIIEMKIEDINKNNSFETDFLSAYRVRFSKYCEAIRKIKIIN
tara:strand:+ start:1620 stop:2237 length:618 start_codon:yes stop_codon:yes gene_type:complete